MRHVSYYLRDRSSVNEVKATKNGQQFSFTYQSNKPSMGTSQSKEVSKSISVVITDIQLLAK